MVIFTTYKFTIHQNQNNENPYVFYLFAIDTIDHILF